MASRRIQVYAVVRVDWYVKDPVESLTVQAIWPTLPEAKAEVERLNQAVDPAKSTYLWRATRYYPDGREQDPTTRLTDEA